MKEKVCAVIFCLIVGVVASSMVIPVVGRNIAGNDTSQSVVAYDGSRDYPFEDGEEPEAERKETGGKISKAVSKFNAAKRVFENITSESYDYKMPLVLTKKTWDKLTGIDMTTSRAIEQDDTTVVDLGDGRISYIVDETPEEDMESLIQFGKETEEKGMNFLLFCTPFKIDEKDEIQSGIYEDNSIEEEKKYINAVRDAGLEVVSVSEAIQEEGLDKRDLFFKTDHHWLPQTALWANKVLCSYLNENLGFSIDTEIFSEENYDITYCEEQWLGSQGKQVTEVYCEREDFPIVVPRYDSNVTAFVSIKNDTLTGPIEDVLLDWSRLEDPNVYDRRNYDFYLYGNIALLSIHNNLVNDGRRILMIKRSFADSMVPSLAAAVENLDVIDLRTFKGSLKTYIEETKPDTIIMVYGVGKVQGEGTYDFR